MSTIRGRVVRVSNACMLDLIFGVCISTIVQKTLRNFISSKKGLRINVKRGYTVDYS